MSAREAGWEHFETEADVGVRAWGSTRADAFAQAALGVFALIVKPDEVAERERREVRAQADSPERLLVNWINECLYVHEIEGFVVHRVEVGACTATLVHATLHGEEMDAGRHRFETIVKAATMHRLVVAEQEGRHEVRLIVDV
ncbi:MAG: archease [Candidatus Rokuibacteriota bacterium]|nr:MAG: archease [Candidatus Rokubacteria bacterium]